MLRDILTAEELAALLTKEELEATQAEKEDRAKQGLLEQGLLEQGLLEKGQLAALLSVVRELQEKVEHLTKRVEQLEGELAQKTNVSNDSTAANSTLEANAGSNKTLAEEVILTSRVERFRKQKAMRK